ncbi:unnamed protein product, partial [Closterium sp. NIES-64]
MVNAQKGVLIECDIPMAQYIIFLDSKRGGAEKFILQVLDDTHMLILADAADMVQKMCRDWMDANTWYGVKVQCVWDSSGRLASPSRVLQYA